MATNKSIEFGSLVVFLVFIALIVVIFYNYLTPPLAKPLPFFVAVFWIITVALFQDFGEYLGVFILHKNFLTEGGLVAVYHSHINHSNGMSEYFFTTQKRYAQFVGYEDYQERNMLQRFFTRLTNSRMCSIIDHSHLFEEVPEYASDTKEGAIIYRGTWRKGVRILSPLEAMKVRLNNAYAVISMIETVAEKAKAISEQSALAQSKDIVDSVIKVGTAVQNMPMSPPRYQPPMQQGGF